MHDNSCIIDTNDKQDFPMGFKAPLLLISLSSTGFM